MRQSVIVHALVTPRLSGGLSSGVTGALYGSAGVLAFVLFEWHPWAAVFPFIGAFVGQVYYKRLFKKDPHYLDIKRRYDATADQYQPWPREELNGRGKRPKGFGRGVRC